MQQQQVMPLLMSNSCQVWQTHHHHSTHHARQVTRMQLAAAAACTLLQTQQWNLHKWPL
jgi:hypothetical protein